MADSATRIIAYMSMHEVFCSFLRQLFCGDISTVFANHNVTPFDQEYYVQLKWINVHALNKLELLPLLDFMSSETSLSNPPLDLPIEFSFLLLIIFLPFLT